MYLSCMYTELDVTVEKHRFKIKTIFCFISLKIKGTVNIISSDPSYKDGNVRLLMVL